MYITWSGFKHSRSLSDATTEHLILFFTSVSEPIVDEERGDDHARHHDDRLLSGRLEREQEKVLR